MADVRTESAQIAIESVHENPHGSAKDELVAVARQLGMSEDLVTENVANALWEYGCHGPVPEEYARTAVLLLDRELAHGIHSA